MKFVLRADHVDGIWRRLSLYWVGVALPWSSDRTEATPLDKCKADETLDRYWWMGNYTPAAEEARCGS